MLKPLTFSVSLAVALGACSLGLAGHHDGYASGQFASTQYPTAQAQCPSPQGVYASPQEYCEPACEVPCAPKRSRLCDLFKKREKCYTYEWVLKKKRCGGLFGGFGRGHGNDCGQASDCVTCGDVIAPSAQYPSAQVYSAPQSYAAPQGQTYGAAQYTTYGAGQFAPAAPAGDAAPAAPAGDAVPAAPEAAPPDTANPSEPQANNGSLLFLAPAGN